jgi:hypothetical protein
MSDDDFTARFWSLTPSQLCRECSAIAQAAPTPRNLDLRAEAGRLAAEWQEAIDLPRSDAFEESRRASQILALRKRTIEILIRVSRNR